MRIRDLADEIISPAEAYIKATYGQAVIGDALPLVLSYFPVASMNPFQRLLYSRAAESGFAIVPTLEMQQLGRINWRGRSVLHLHWLASVLRGAATRSAARGRIEAFKADLAGWRAAGHRIVWSMHNVLPHDCVFMDAEIELRRALVEGVDAIHVLSVASITEARKHYDLPEEKVFHVPHPSYVGWYANVDNAIGARLDLDLPIDGFTFLFFGSLQPYKGVVELVEAFIQLRRLHPGRKLQLVIAGKPLDEDYAEQIRLAVEHHPGIRFIPSAMQENEVQVLFNASDVVVAPYRRTLNSGVAMLAASFRKPVVGPDGSGLRETFVEDPSLLYAETPGEGLLEAMDRAIGHAVSPTVFDGILAAHDPGLVSKTFFEQVRKRLFDSTATTTT